jgi:restriction system protein
MAPLSTRPAARTNVKSSDHKMPEPHDRSIFHPPTPVPISPEEYELQVVAWLKGTGSTLASFEVTHLRHLEGPGGEYAFDAVAVLSILNGAQITMLVECKRTGRPVEREDLLALWAKLQDVKAHKAMLFSTSGFQRGALEYAAAYGIATVVFVDGQSLYMTKGMGGRARAPAWAALPPFAGILVRQKEDTINGRTIDVGHLEALSEWLQARERDG